MYISIGWFPMACLVTALCCYGTAELYGQESSQWPPKKNPTPFNYVYNNTKSEYGYILLKDRDTLKGKIKLLPYQPNIYRYILFLAMDKYRWQDIVFVPRYDISYVRTYPDQQMPDSGITDFVNLHDRDLWRKLASKGSWTIYDDHTPGFDNRPFGTEMILVGKDRKWIKIYHHRYTDFTTEELPRMRDFINKRYNAQFQASDFPDAPAMIHYILDKETVN